MLLNMFEEFDYLDGYTGSDPLAPLFPAFSEPLHCTIAPCQYPTGSTWMSLQTARKCERDRLSAKKHGVTMFGFAVFCRRSLQPRSAPRRYRVRCISVSKYLAHNDRRPDNDRIVVSVSRSGPFSALVD